MYQRTNYPSILARKREGFIRDIQNITRDDIKKRYRTEMIHHLDQQQLALIITNTNFKTTQQDIQLLVKYANQQYPKAVAHLGNLLLDGIITTNQIQKFNLAPGYHPYWLWLIEVMIEQEYCTLNLLDHVIKSIAPQRSQDTVRSALSILFKIVSSSLHSPLLFRDQETFTAILNACDRQDSASVMGYLVIKKLVQKNDCDFKVRLKDGKLRQRVVRTLLNGSMRSDKKTKVLTIKIIFTLLQKGVLFNQLFQTQMMLMKQAIQMETEALVLEMFMELVNKATVQDVMHLVDLGLIVQLGQWKKQFEQKEQKQELDQIILLSRELNQKVRGLGYISKGVYRQMERFCLLSYSNKMEICQS